MNKSKRFLLTTQPLGNTSKHPVQWFFAAKALPEPPSSCCKGSTC